ncbi:probable inactive receptor kinase At3g08680 [Diospyros lotus]|uniref:probable inactive receptor kinase At3g08680 n=1 Tax=Diospyros lotus TaxID=55363 RepID=UPI0022514FA9|nr:probable inactive receptor kinase At3g08680 [Diospyros lotus]XP_052174099.1 probable inactive receptor kinase At3g08680 [Diospyros lotus]
MKLHNSSAPLTVLLFLFLVSRTIADLNIDKQALLNFAAVVPHSRKINWKSSSPICSSWVGVSCDPNGTRVIALRLPGVGLYGPIPANTLGKLDELTILSLRSNFLNGSLPSDILSLRSLQSVHLQQNNFSGDIPSSLSPKLSFLDLSFNSFTGNIPDSIQNLAYLTELDLQNNSLSGPIPLVNAQRLNHFNVSYNHLNGSIPSSLQKFPVSSFEGNSMLCGSPLNQCSMSPSPSPSPSPAYLPPSPSQAYFPPPLSPNHLPISPTFPPHKQRAKKKLTMGAIIAIAVGSSAVLFLAVLMTLLLCSKKKCGSGSGVQLGKAHSGVRSDKPREDFSSGVQVAEKNKLVFFEGCSYNFDLEDLLRASAEVVGKGSYGTTYKAILEEGTTVVVKRLKEVVVGKREFEQQMETVGRVGRHPNVMPLRAYFYSKDEKLLVCDYLRGGSLSSQLHGNKETGRTLDWESRLKICLGAARGVAHIHSAGGAKFTHGSIKSSNVLLTQDLRGCRISDFGLTPLMGLPTIPLRNAGYRAPEMIETKRSTQKSDVYSFGVLLLEILTGKAPAQSPGHDDVVDLPRWVQSVVREEWTAEVFDVELMMYQNIEEEMVQMLQIAMACVEKVPEMRPKMEEVVKMIEDIRPSDTDNGPSSKDNKSRSPTPPTSWLL